MTGGRTPRILASQASLHRPADVEAIRDQLEEAVEALDLLLAEPSAANREAAAELLALLVRLPNPAA